MLSILLASATAVLTVTVPDHLIARAVDGLPLVEPHVAVSPTDPSHLVAGAIVAAPERDGPWRCAAFHSKDRGASFERHDFEIDRCIDPWVLVLADGSALFAAIEILRDVQGDQRFRLVLFRSHDGGASWPDAPEVSGRGYEHPILLEHGGDVFLAARRMRPSHDGSSRHLAALERSRDGGRSFELLAEVEPSDLGLNVTGVSSGPERLVLTFHDFRPDAPDSEPKTPLLRHRAYALVSRDGGASFSRPRFITDSCGVPDGFPGYPFQTSGPGADTLYFACIAPAFEGVLLLRSLDGGESWSGPTRVDAGSTHARTPMLAVNPSGVLGAAWYDRSEDPERECQHLYFTASMDSGQSFAPPLRVSTGRSCPQQGENGRVAESWAMGGDYSSLTAGPDGAFHVVWADSRSGRFELHAAELAVRERGDAR